MNLATGTSLFYSLGQPTKYLIAGLSLATVKQVNTLEQMAF